MYLINIKEGSITFNLYQSDERVTLAGINTPDIEKRRVNVDYIPGAEEYYHQLRELGVIMVGDTPQVTDVIEVTEVVEPAVEDNVDLLNLLGDVDLDAIVVTDSNVEPIVEEVAVEDTSVKKKPGRKSTKKE